MPAPDDEPTAAQALRTAAGAFVRPLQRLVRALLGEPRTIPELVAATGMPRRDVEQALAAVDADLERAAGGYRVAAARRDEYAAVFDLRDLDGGGLDGGLDDVVGSRLAARPDLVELIAGLAGARPRPDRQLDHVAATPETVARRALWLDSRYDLARTELLCVGDHDLTSLAVAACTPGARITVVDVDDRVLALIDGLARQRGWAIRCLWGDFRLGLPGSAAGVAGLAFTDPPYTPDGVSTFLVAALAGLGDTERGRIVLAYGYGDHQPALGLAVQQAIGALHIAFEAILPGFNRYDGAQAIGSRSDLYVCRPTARTWRALPALRAARLPGEAIGRGGRIYTHGEQSVESAAAPAALAALDTALDTALVDGLGQVPAGTPDSRLLLVGDGWPPPAGTGAAPHGVPHGAQRTSVAALLARGVPPQLAGVAGVHALLDLSQAPAAWLPRLLLAVNAARVVAVVPTGAWPIGDGALVRDKYDVVAHPVPGGRFDVVTASGPPSGPGPTSAVARDVLSRAHGRLGNVWREALVAAARERGRTLTKNEARALVERSCSMPDLLGARLVELPRHLLEAIVGEIRTSQAALA